MFLWSRIMKLSIMQKVAIVTTLFVSGMLFDLLLSLNAYMMDSSFFIQYEANREIVSFFVSHTFPIMNFSMLFISAPFVFWAFSAIRLFNNKLDGSKEQRKERWLYKYEASLFEIGVIVFMLRICGGLTWYFGLVPMILLSIFTGLVFGNMLILVYCLVRLQVSLWRQEKVDKSSM